MVHYCVLMFHEAEKHRAITRVDTAMCICLFWPSYLNNRLLKVSNKTLRQPWPNPYTLFPVICRIKAEILLTKRHVWGHVSSIPNQKDPCLSVAAVTLVPWGMESSTTVNREPHGSICLMARGSEFNAPLQTATAHQLLKPDCQS